MEFLTLLIVLALLRVWGGKGPLQNDEWFQRLCDETKSRVSDSLFRILIVVLAPTLLVFFILFFFHSLWLGVFTLVIYCCVLLFSMGRGDINGAIDSYVRAWNEGDLDQARSSAQEINDTGQWSDDPEDSTALHEDTRGALLYASFERWFSVVFWFFLLGPAAALAYRLSFLSLHSDSLGDREREIAAQWVFYLEWIPVRLLALTFTLTGNFVVAFNRSWQLLWEEQSTQELLQSSALAAISGFDDKAGYPSESELYSQYASAELLAIQSLLSRSIVCWIAVVAILEVIG